MMFAHGGDVDVPDDDHFIVLLSRQRNDMLARVLAQAGSQLNEHLGHSSRRLLQTRAIRVLANAFEYQTHATRDALEIDAPTRTVFVFAFVIDLFYFDAHSALGYFG